MSSGATSVAWARAGLVTLYAHQSLSKGKVSYGIVSKATKEEFTIKMPFTNPSTGQLSST